MQPINIKTKGLIVASVSDLPPYQDGTVLCYQLNAHDIALCNIAPAVIFFRDLADNPELVLAYANRVTLSWSGYDNDARELYEIEQARKFASELYEASPFIFHFLSSELKSFQLFLLQLSKVEKQYQAGNQIGVSVDYSSGPANILAIMEKAFELHRKHSSALSIDQVKHLSECLQQRVMNTISQQ